MKTLATLAALACAATFTLSAQAVDSPARIQKEQAEASYKMAKKQAKADEESAEAQCKTLSGDARKQCKKDADAAHDKTMAERRRSTRRPRPTTGPRSKGPLPGPLPRSGRG